MVEITPDGEFTTEPRDKIQDYKPDFAATTDVPTQKTAPVVVPAPEPLPPPVVDAVVKPAKRGWNPKGAVVNTIMAILVLCFGGLVAFSGLRRITFFRLIVELVVLGVAAVLTFLGLTWYLPDLTSTLSFHDPVTIALIAFGMSVVFAYVGGLITFRGSRYAGDPRVGGLVLAIGFTLLGLRVATLGITIEEVRMAGIQHSATATMSELLKQASADKADSAASTFKAYEDANKGETLGQSLSRIFGKQDPASAPTAPADIKPAASPTLDTYSK